VAAVDDITIRVSRGEIYGFLGLNGAGKTTVIRMLLGMIKPDKGSIHLFGKELNRHFNGWNAVGYMVETPASYPDLTVYENLRVFFTLRLLSNKSLIDEIIEELQLERYRNIKSKYLSLGNKQRLGLAKALMHHPQLLILDEPINGLDPAGIVEVRELLKQLAQEGTTIFLSSHILGEISKVANRIGIIHNGKLIKELTNAELNLQLIKKLLIKSADNNAAQNILQQQNFNPIINTLNEIELTDVHALQHPEEITKLLTHAGQPPQQIYTYTEDLEMYFLRNVRNNL
jgi:ABC-2 type transport system ATP-binding protein